MSDTSEITDIIKSLIGDAGLASYTAAQVDDALAVALARYSQTVERVETKTFKLKGAGIFAQSLENWGAGLQAVAYVHWPAVSTVAATTAENKVLDWWAYLKSDGYFYLDLLIDGSTRPALDDYILVTGVTTHEINGFTYLGAAGAATSVPKIHWGLLALGAAAYAMRSRESTLAVQGGGPDFSTAYHVGVLSDLANRMEERFEMELAKIAEKRLERPPWGYPEKKRMRRIMADG
jgi:hypothetical protein